MNGIYNKTWKDLYVSTKVFATINAISFKQARKVRDVMLNLYIPFVALVWKTLTFKLDNHIVNFLVVSLTDTIFEPFPLYFTPQTWSWWSKKVWTQVLIPTSHFYTFVRSTGNQVCVTRTKCNVQHPGCRDTQCASQAGVLYVTDLDGAIIQSNYKDLWLQGKSQGANGHIMTF